MERDKMKDSTTGLPALAIFRGLYNRVAEKLGVDPSYVSRVARGERKSAAILAALEEEMLVIREHLNRHLDGKLPGNGNNGVANDGRAFVDGSAQRNGQMNWDGTAIPDKARSGRLSNGVGAGKKNSGKRSDSRRLD